MAGDLTKKEPLLYGYSHVEPTCPQQRYLSGLVFLVDGVKCAVCDSFLFVIFIFIVYATWWTLCTFCN